jgi:hypothetical protein
MNTSALNVHDRKAAKRISRNPFYRKERVKRLNERSQLEQKLVEARNELKKVLGSAQALGLAWDGEKLAAPKREEA